MTFILKLKKYDSRLNSDFGNLALVLDPPSGNRRSEAAE